MGLLDDAIREHLELKRLRGADPGEVAREQREALDPVPREEDLTREDDSTAAENVAPETSDRIAPVDVTPAGDPPTRTDFSTLRQETAELDMRTVLAGDHDVLTENPSLVGPVPAGPPRRVPSGEPHQEDWPRAEAGFSGEPTAYAGGRERTVDDDDAAEYA
jgi:hypothetical protein